MQLRQTKINKYSFDEKILNDFVFSSADTLVIYKWAESQYIDRVENPAYWQCFCKFAQFRGHRSTYYHHVCFYDPNHCRIKLIYADVSRWTKTWHTLLNKPTQLRLQIVRQKGMFIVMTLRFVTALYVHTNRKNRNSS